MAQLLFQSHDDHGFLLRFADRAQCARMRLVAQSIEQMLGDAPPPLAGRDRITSLFRGKLDVGLSGRRPQRSSVSRSSSLKMIVTARPPGTHETQTTALNGQQ